jgi:hypothetical protein
MASEEIKLITQLVNINMSNVNVYLGQIFAIW